MAELDPYQRSGITKRLNTRSAFLDTATGLFAAHAYADIRADDIARRSGRSTATFYNFFTAKSDWGAAVLDERLNEALDQQITVESGSLRAPHTRLLGHLGLLGDVSAPLPGITQALVEERTAAQAPYGELLPTYYGEVTQAVRDGQEQRVFRDDMTAAEMADFVLDSLALAYAVHLDSPAPRSTAGLPSLLLDGLARE